jgi:predicted kinase
MLIVFRGLPGTGKTHLVRRLLRERPDFLVLSRDAVRADIISRPTFSEEEKTLVDDLILSMTGFLLARGSTVVIDGMALSSAKRVDQFAAAAVSHGAGLRVIECVCSEKTALARLNHDGASHPAGDRGEALYRAVKARFQPITQSCLTVDTDLDERGNLDSIRAFLKDR